MEIRAAETAEPNIEAAYERLYKAEQRRANTLAAISAASREIVTSLDLQSTLILVMDKAAETLPMDAGVLFLSDRDTQQFEVAVSHNLTAERVARISFAFNEGVPGWVVNQQEPLIIGDATLDPRVHPAVVEEGVKSVLAIPLVARDDVIGVLNLYSLTHTQAFDAEALQVAQVYADQTAVFIENARLMEELRLSAAQLEARVERRTEQLRQKQAQVIRAEKLAAVGRLAASVAHEVNNPLQAMTLHLEVMADEPLSELAGNSIILVQHELNRIAGIVQRLLDFQRPRTGERTCQDIRHLLQDVITLSMKQFQRAGVQVALDIPPGLDLTLVVRDQIEQVFLNLILNAIDAMPNGGRLDIAAEKNVGANSITIRFADSGVGMSEDVLGQLFEPFFSTKHSGSGLGLAVSHEIVANHEGTLTAESVIGAGSTFCITLPIC